MSTKTTFKRVALVAVASLGFGVLSSVAPANAAIADGHTIQQGSVTLNTATTTYAARVGQEVAISLSGDIAANTAAATVAPALSIAASITSQPAGSAIYPTLAAVDPTSTSPNYNAKFGVLDYTAVGLNFEEATVDTSSTGSANTVATINYTGDSDDDVLAATAATLGTLKFTPTVKGVYTVVVWNETSRTVAAFEDDLTPDRGLAATQAALSGAESFQTFTINVVDAVSTVAISAVNSTFAKEVTASNADEYGALLR